MRNVFYGFYFLGALSCCIITISLQGSEKERSKLSPRVLSGIVKLSVTQKKYAYLYPWRPPETSKVSGSGFVIDEKHILTNAHVVHNATLVRFKLANDLGEYTARVKAIAADCDLAILESLDRSFESSRILALEEYGASTRKLPDLQSYVSVYGYPIGGNQVSITRGVVSRIDIDFYSYSGLDRHLVIQVDAAINPGNSGGPAVQNGKVIGMAFQGNRRGEGLGYLIPVSVIRHFLQDLADGHYDGFPELGIFFQSTAHRGLRKALNLDGLFANSKMTGVYVNSVIPGSSSDGLILRGDILVAVNNYEVSSFGEIRREGQIYPLEQIVEESFLNDTLQVKILRDGKFYILPIRAQIVEDLNFQRRNHLGAPKFALYGNLVFQPVTADLLSGLARIRYEKDFTAILFRYSFFLRAGIYKEVNEDVLLTYIFPVKNGDLFRSYEHSIVRSVGGTPVKDLQHFVYLMDEALQKNRTLRIDFINKEIPLLIRPQDMRKSMQEIKERYQLVNLREVN